MKKYVNDWYDDDDDNELHMRLKVLEVYLI